MQRWRMAALVPVAALLAPLDTAHAADWQQRPEPSMSTIAVPPVIVRPGRTSQIETATLQFGELAPLRVHLSISRPPAPPEAAWAVRILGEGGTVLDALGSDSELVTVGAFWRADGGADYWTGLVSLPKALEVRGPAGLTVTVDRIARTRLKAQPEAFCAGTAHRMLLSSAAPRIQEWSRSVALIDVQPSLGDGFPCTGFLLGESLLLTNHHCIGDAATAVGSNARFAVDAPGDTGRNVRVVKLLSTSPTLDYTLLKLEGRPATDYGRLYLSQALPTENQALVVIQHPGGVPKQVADDCRVRGPSKKNLAGMPADFGHVCDTNNGSSGSPVFDFGSGLVVGLHHLGARGCDPEADPDFVNQALRSDQLVESLRKDVGAGRLEQAIFDAVVARRPPQ